MSQYPIPQFIEEEGKIISFLTFRQFFLLVGGGVVCGLLYLVLPLNIWFFAAGAVMLIIAAIAFIKVEGTSITSLLFHLISFSTKSKTYTWRKKEVAYPLGGRIVNTNSMMGSQNYSRNTLKEIKKIIETKK